MFPLLHSARSRQNNGSGCCNDPIYLKDSISRVDDAVEGDVHHSCYRIGPINYSVDEDDTDMANKRVVRDAISKLVRAQNGLVRPLTDENRMAWQILDDAIGYLIRAEYPLWNLF
jgi:hypothetical protein